MLLQFKHHRARLISPAWISCFFLLAVCCKTASTNANSAIFVQLFRDLVTFNWCFMQALVASMHTCCSWSQLVAATSVCSNVRRWSKSCTECEIEMILKRDWLLESGRVAATSKQHRFKLNRCECCLTDLKKDSASLILVYPILLLFGYGCKNYSFSVKATYMTRKNLAPDAKRK